MKHETIVNFKKYRLHFVSFSRIIWSDGLLRSNYSTISKCFSCPSTALWSRSRPVLSKINLLNFFVQSKRQSVHEMCNLSNNQNSLTTPQEIWSGNINQYLTNNLFFVSFAFSCQQCTSIYVLNGFPHN